MRRLVGKVRGIYMYSIHDFFFQAEDGIRELVRSRGLGDVYKRQPIDSMLPPRPCSTISFSPAEN